MITHTKEKAMDTQKMERSGKLICIKVFTISPCHPNIIVMPAKMATIPVYIKRALKHPLRSAKLRVMCCDTAKMSRMPTVERTASCPNLSNRENKSENALEKEV